LLTEFDDDIGVATGSAYHADNGAPLVHSGGKRRQHIHRPRADVLDDKTTVAIGAGAVGPWLAFPRDGDLRAPGRFAVLADDLAGYLLIGQLENNGSQLEAVG